MAKKPTIQARKPPRARALSVGGSQSAAALRYATGEDAAAVEIVDGVPMQTRRVRDLDGSSTTYTLKRGAAAGQALRRVTLYFPEELHKQARIAAIEADVPLSELVVGMVSKALNRK